MIVTHVIHRAHIVGPAFAGLMVFVALFTALRSPASAEEQTPEALRTVTIREKLGGDIDLSRAFIDHTGVPVTLAQYVADGKPVLLTLNYYECPMLCTLMLNSLVRGVGELRWKPGDRYRMVTISIDPDETPALAAAKRASYLTMLGMGDDVDWSFLVGTKENIDAVANAIGFEYTFDEKTAQYAHPAALFFISRSGKVARYLYGIEYAARDLKFAIVETSEGRAGSPIDKLILSCFHYDSTVGAYGPWAMGAMRLGGGVGATLLALFLFVMWRRESRARRMEGLA